tara:strand:- start:6 stop:140 length:135 start_codon:yes stop_codon:yes gene_type:complete
MSRKKRNPVVQAMIRRSQKAGRHIDRKKQANKKECRKKIKNLDK